MIEDMYAVMTRINEIRKRFSHGMRHDAVPAGKGFGPELDRRIAEVQDARQTGVAEIPGGKAVRGADRALSVQELKDIARQAAVRNNVPAGLVDAVIQVESGYNTTAVSPKGARGLMQIMPEVASAVGLADPFSPEDNINTGVSILGRLLQKYGGDYKNALAAYNAGEGAVDRSGGVPPYRETRDYVRKVIDLYLKNSD